MDGEFTTKRRTLAREYTHAAKIDEIEINTHVKEEKMKKREKKENKI